MRTFRRACARQHVCCLDARTHTRRWPCNLVAFRFVVQLEWLSFGRNSEIAVIHVSAVIHACILRILRRLSSCDNTFTLCVVDEDGQPKRKLPKKAMDPSDPAYKPPAKVPGRLKLPLNVHKALVQSSRLATRVCQWTLALNAGYQVSIEINSFVCPFPHGKSRRCFHCRCDDAGFLCVIFSTYS